MENVITTTQELNVQISPQLPVQQKTEFNTQVVYPDNEQENFHSTPSNSRTFFILVGIIVLVAIALIISIAHYYSNNYIVVGETMRTFTATHCAAYPIPTGTNYTSVGMLRDERDGKFYEIRKFADGQCWMVDDLRYGGVNDECANQANFNTDFTTGQDNKSGSAWGYGHCRDPRQDCAAGLSKQCICANDATCGYHYNWQAAVQQPDANFGGSYSNFTDEIQGICPDGWRLPIGFSDENDGDFDRLFFAIGGDNEPGAHFSCDDYDDPYISNACKFFLPTGSFKSVLGGYTTNNTQLRDQGSNTSLWTGTGGGVDVSSASILLVYPNDARWKYQSSYTYQGNPVRCIKTMDSQARQSTAPREIINPLPTPKPSSQQIVVESQIVNGGAITRVLEPTPIPKTTDLSYLQNNTVIGTMQTWNQCDNYPTPPTNGHLAIGHLTDERDGKIYEVRKFADGKCWMVDNLKYGGSPDACVNKTTYDGESNQVETPWGMGDCRDSVDAGAPCDTNLKLCGYYYNWQAAMNSVAAYYGNDLVVADQVQGICPDSWHLPSNAEFITLDVANGGTGVGRYGCANDPGCEFWIPKFSWKGLYSGHVSFTSNLNGQGATGDFWTSNQNVTPYHASALSISVYGGGGVDPGSSDRSKADGLPVRCVAN